MLKHTQVERTRHAVQAFRTGQLASIGHRTSTAPKPPDVPLRDDAYLQSAVAPMLMRRSRKRAGMLHALANIEQWAYAPFLSALFELYN